MSDDSRKKNPWRGDPPPAPIPGANPRPSETTELEPSEVDANLDFAVGPRRPPKHFAAAPRAASSGEENMAPQETADSEPVPAPPPPVADDEDSEAITLSSRKEDSEMDMTPMVDIVFQLLIFFMVTAAFSLQKSKQFPTPKEDKPSATAMMTPEETGDEVTVRVDAYNTFHVQTPDFDEEAPSEQDLLIKLRRARDGASDGKIPTRMKVQANKDASHEKVVVALDAGAIVGMEQISLQTVEQDEE